jgi:hypothetical protein
MFPKMTSSLMMVPIITERNVYRYRSMKAKNILFFIDPRYDGVALKLLLLVY